MFSTERRNLRVAQPRVCVVLLGAWMLAGCESVPSLPEIDLLPPTLFGTDDGAGEDTSGEQRPAPTVAREGRSDWFSVSGPIFDWRAEGIVGPRTTATDGEAPTGPAVPAPPATPAPAGAPTSTPVVITLTPAARLGEIAPTEDRTPPAPAWQRATGPIFDWTAEARTAAQPAPEPEPPSAWQLRERQLRGLPGWRLNGRVAISSPEESWSAVLRWDQQGDAFHVRLSNPLGQGLLDLRGVPGEVLLRTAEGQVYRAPNAETLLRDVAGMSLPVSGLRYWLLAATDPDAAKADVRLDGDSLPLSVEQAGWLIEYDRYRDADGLRLPDRLTFKGADLGGRLIVTQWDLLGS